jgi:hypothetical protein
MPNFRYESVQLWLRSRAEEERRRFICSIQNQSPLELSRSATARPTMIAEVCRSAWYGLLIDDDSMLLKHHSP